MGHLPTLRKYIFIANQVGICAEPCPQTDQIKIGSTSCIRCAHCVGFDHEESWIKCPKIIETKIPTPPPDRHI